MSSPVSPSSGTRPFWETQAPAEPKPKSGANKETFMQLLVAQVKHQNPLNPFDGAEFLAQLAQFSELEQMMEIRTELAALRQDLTPKKDSGESK